MNYELANENTHNCENNDKEKIKLHNKNNFKKQECNKIRKCKTKM